MIDNSTIFKEILEIADLPSPTVHFTYQGELLIKGQSDPIKLAAIKSFTRTRDYVTNRSDVIMLECAVGAGTYQHKIQPAKNALTAVLYRIPINSDNNTVNTHQPQYVEHYTAVLVDSDVDYVANPDARNVDSETGDQTDQQLFTLQLIDQVLAPIRLTSISGIFPKTTVGKLLKVLMGQWVGGDEPPPVVDPTPKTPKEVRGVDVVEPTNDRVFNHIIIPEGTRILDLPNYLQETYGVYSGNISYYLQRGVWYIYPIYNTSRWDTTLPCITIGMVPQNRMPGADKSFKVKSKQIYILATGNNKHRDTSEHLLLNKGNGVRYLPAENVIDALVTVSKHKAKASRKANMVEYIVEPRADELNSVLMSTRRITDNHLREQSQLASRLGGKLLITWENADVSKLTPGMPVKVLYEKEDKTEILMGVLIGVTEMAAPNTPGQLNTQFISNAALTIFVERA